MTKFDLNRRALLRGGIALGCSAAASPLLTPVTLAAAPTDKRFVVIVLRGGMDALDVIEPYGDRRLAALRPDLGGEPRKGSIDLDGFFRLHGSLKPLAGMWKAGELAFAHAVSTPYRNKRSHFDGQDALENGTGDQTGQVTPSGDGWLNRTIGLIPGAASEFAIAVGRENMLLLDGRNDADSWAPDSKMELENDERNLIGMLYQNDPLFMAAASEAMELGEMTGDMAGGGNMGGRARRASVEPLAKFTARMLAGDYRVAAFSINGWDTHNKQAQTIERPLAALAGALKILKQDLGPAWANTAVIAMTEFGRTARQNGSFGTDHGTGGGAIFAGGAIRGGKVHGDWPGLGDGDLYQQRDLMPTSDVRRYAAWMLRGMYGLSASDVEQTIFPGLDLGSEIGLIA